jgi:hypothetical protein
MRLELDHTDLDEHRVDPRAEVTFKDFKENAQAAITAVGVGLFYRYKGTPNQYFAAIYPPSQREK